MDQTFDQIQMRLALELAQRGGRAVMPNPLVGAVITNGTEVLATGYHQRFGGAHAEVNAINSVSDQRLLSTSTLYVNLEPCSHTGKTPPCADLIVKHRIPKVVVGIRDPFPEVSGRGIAKLREAGVTVVEGALSDECALLNKRFIVAHLNKRPYIILKWAQSADGYIAPISGERTQISSAESNALLHYWRGQEMAIGVGVTTALKDDPLLTVRDTTLYEPSELPPIQPTRIVIGDSSKLPSSLKIFHTDAPTLLTSTRPGSFNASEITYDQTKPLLPQLLTGLYERGITSIIIEGGAETLTKAISSELWDEARVITAPLKLNSGISAPRLPYSPICQQAIGADTIDYFEHPELRARRLEIAP
jgi:diaminohydroxyphosphoribosylaminopyrimidine deaminase/5-amino-6-(5-phosphoribosylamino)uracil reductase